MERVELYEELPCGTQITAVMQLGPDSKTMSDLEVTALVCEKAALQLKHQGIRHRDELKTFNARQGSGGTAPLP